MQQVAINTRNMSKVSLLFRKKIFSYANKVKGGAGEGVNSPISAREYVCGVVSQLFDC